MVLARSRERAEPLAAGKGTRARPLLPAAGKGTFARAALPATGTAVGAAIEAPPWAGLVALCARALVTATTRQSQPLIGSTPCELRERLRCFESCDCSTPIACAAADCDE